MKKIKYIQIGILALTLGITSCNDDKFLEENPSTFYTTDNVYSSSSQVDQLLISIYNQIRDLWVNPAEAADIRVFRGNGTDMYDVPSNGKARVFNNYSIIYPGTKEFYDIYSDWYSVISRANLAIYAAELPQISWASDSEKAYVLAQARFFRAFAYRNLAELFGGVSIVTDITKTPQYDYERASRVETYQFAIDELEAIENDLPETTKSGGRLVRGAAQHNLCELYLAKGIELEAEGKTPEAQAAYNKSVSYGDQIINGGTYSLINSRFGTRKSEKSVSINIYKNGVVTQGLIDTMSFTTNYYWDLFQEGNVNYQEGNGECIWAAQIDYTAFKAGDVKSKLPYSRMYGPAFRIGSKDHVTGLLEDVGGRGITDVMPTMYARDSVFAGKWGNDMRNSEIVFRRRFKGNVATSSYYKKNITLDFFYNQSTDGLTNMNNKSFCYPISCKYSTDKYTGLTDGQDRSNLFRDDYIIRLPETILLRAEAKQLLGNKTGAAADVNLLRARAQCGYLVSAADMDDNFNTILDERARELIYEECRWNTLLRMGGTIAVDRIRKYAFWPETQATLTFNYNLWPIPQTVIDINKDLKLEQNPGWQNK